MNSERRGTLYQEVYDYLLKKIESEFRPGDLLPPQSKIAEDTHTSLITVKRAIKELEAQGFLFSKAGKGTIVKKPSVVDNHIGVSSWTDSIAGQGKVPSTAWMTVKKRKPASSIVNMLDLKARERTVRIERLRLIDDEPICLMTNEIPLRLVPDIREKTMDDESLYTYLKDHYGLIPVYADEEVYARTASDYEIKQLQLKTPFVLVVERLSWLSDNVPFEFSSIIASASSYIYRSRQINKTLDPEVLKNIIIKEN